MSINRSQTIIYAWVRCLTWALLLCTSLSASAQVNLVLNGNMDSLDDYAHRDRGTWSYDQSQPDTGISQDAYEHPCHNAVTRYWDTTETRGRLALHHESHSGSYYRYLNVYAELDDSTYHAGIDRAQLIRPLVRGCHYRVSLAVLPLSGNFYYDQLAFSFSDTLATPPPYFIDIGMHYSSPFGYTYTHSRPIRYRGSYEVVSFDYLAHGGERYLYIGHLSGAYLGRVRKVRHYPTDCYTCSRPAVALAIDDLMVTPLDTGSLCSCIAAEAPATSTSPPVTALSDTVLAYTYYYDTDQSEALPEVKARIATICQTPGLTSISIVGHTDSVGTDAYNQQLSYTRAESVQRVIKQACAITTTIAARGASQPVDHTPSSPRNRRVEVYCILHKK